VDLTSNAVGGTEISQQSLTGGDPGAFWKSSITVNAVDTSRYALSYFDKAAIYEPSMSGAILGLSGGFRMSLLSYTSIRDSFEASLVLRQNGGVYVTRRTYGLQHAAPAWFGFPPLYTEALISSPGDWVLVTSGAPALPDFSGHGSTIQFGFMAGATFDSGSGTIVGGLDNWNVMVRSTGVSSVPLPKTISSVAALAAIWGAGMRWRIKRGTAGATRLS
jgi:hypothetical protein